MNRNSWTRPLHRWTSIAFTIGVITNMVAMRDGAQPPGWVGATALIPLIILLVTGLVLFAQPYVARLRDGRRAPVRTGDQPS